MWLIGLLACTGKDEDSTVIPDLVAEIEVSPLQLDFGEVRSSGAPSDPGDIAISNVGTLDLTVSSITTASPYSVSPAEALLVPGQVVHLIVIFDPVEAGDWPGSVSIVSADEDEPEVVVNLSGVGT